MDRLHNVYADADAQRMDQRRSLATAEGVESMDRQWNQMLARSFHPQDWYQRDVNGNLEGEGMIMWVMRYDKMTDLWDVGYYAPNREWWSESLWKDKEKAAQRVSMLNGGAPIALPKPPE